MQTGRIRLARLSCQRAAPSGAPAGVPVLLIHGLGGGIWGWENFQRRFAECGRVSYAIELPLHDGPPDRRLGDYSVESFALHAAAALAEIGPCFVAGHSMGGLIAQKLAEAFPRPGYAFLCSAPPWHFFRRAYWPLWWHALRHPWREILRSANSEPLLLDRALEDDLVNNRLPEELRERMYRRDVPDSGRAGLQMALGLVKVDERRVAAPCMVVAGAADRLIPLSEQRRLAALYRCPLRVFDRGHMLLLEDGWEEIADALLAWMECLERAAVGAAPPRDRRTSATAIEWQAS